VSHQLLSGGWDDGPDVTYRLAKGLGWYSLVLAAAQLLAPRTLTRWLGLDDNERNVAVMRAVGVRELVKGVGILTSYRPAGWLWARVAGDAMDLTMLGMARGARRNAEQRRMDLTMLRIGRGARRDDEQRRRRVDAGIAAVAGTTAVDLWAAAGMTRRAPSARGRALHLRKAVTVAREPAEVYRYWRNLENLPRFMTHLESVRLTGDGRSRWTASAPAGRVVEWDAEIIDDRPNESLGWRSLQGADVPNSGSVRFTPAPGGRGTEVRVELNYSPPAGKVGVTVAKLFGEEPGQQLRDDLRRFKQVVETGEVVRSEATPEGTSSRRLLRQRPAQPLGTTTA
jgi:uncharacterized membrane protein